MKNNYIKLSIVTIIVTIILVVFFYFGIPYYKNKIIINENGTLVRDAEVYYNVRSAVVDYYNLLTNRNSYKEVKKVILSDEEFTNTNFNDVISSYQSFTIYVDKIYKLSDNAYRCTYTLKQNAEQLVDYLEYEDLIDENIYNNTVIIKFNKEFNKYKVLYNRLELKGGSVYEK